MAVRLDKNLRATIDKIVASYNQKLRYYDKKGYTGLPSKASVKRIKSLSSRKAINKELTLLKELNKSSLEKVYYGDLVGTRYEKKYFEDRLKSSKLALRKRIKNIGKMEFKTAGKGAGFTYADRFDLLYGNIDEGLNKGRIRSDKLISNMRKYERISTTSYKDYLSMSKEEKESFMNLLERAETPYINPKLKEQFLNSMNDLGYAYGIDKEKLALIEKKVTSLNNDEFDRVFTRDLAVQKIFDYYYLMKMQLGRNSIENQEEVKDLFETLYSNIDEIVKI